jgi:hypothetical protein
MDNGWWLEGILSRKRDTVAEVASVSLLPFTACCKHEAIHALTESTAARNIPPTQVRCLVKTGCTVTVDTTSSPQPSRWSLGKLAVTFKLTKADWYLHGSGTRAREPPPQLRQQAHEQDPFPL